MTSRISILGACVIAAVASLAVTAVAADVVSMRVHDVPRPRFHRRPARYIVRYRTGTVQRTSATQSLATASAALTRSGLVASHPGLSMRYLRRLATGADLVSVSRPLDAVDSATLLRTLAADPTVLSVTPDRRFQHTGIVART
jgi:serine protease